MLPNSRRSLIIYCGLLSTLGAISTDVLLPVFGNMQKSFATSIELVQLTVPIYIVCLGISQFFMGSLSDRFGRRPIIIAGLSLYLAGTLVAMIYPSITLLLVGRAIQGFGGGCGQVIARAMLRDTCEGREYSIALAQVMAIFAIGPIIGPLIGAIITFDDTWRPVFIFMGCFGTAMMVYAVFKLRETLENKNPNATQPSILWTNAKTFFGDAKTLYLLVVACSAKISLYSFLINGPVVFAQELGMSGFDIAILFAITGLGIVVGQICNARSIKVYGEVPTMRIAAGILLFCGIMIALGGYSEWLTAIYLCAFLTLFNTSFLVVFTNSAAMIINRHSTMTGFASAIFGVTSQVTGAGLAAVTILFINGSATSWGILIAVTTGFSLFLLMRWKDEMPA